VALFRYIFHDQKNTRQATVTIGHRRCSGIKITFLTVRKKLEKPFFFGIF
jgi:hypothetical protein